MKGKDPEWSKYAVLGVVLGVAYLAKAIMLPLGMVILACSLLAVKDWRRAVAPAMLAGLLVLGIGAIYFIPLSHLRGHLTLGESGSFNYLYHVDRAGPTWYIRDLGAGKGRLRYVPQRVFETPPTYQFSFPYAVTHPLRFDPSYWTQGARPGFRLRLQYAAIRENLHLLTEIAAATGGLAVGFLILLLTADKPMGVLRLWPLWLNGLVGLVMYDLVHVENRYVGVFFVLLWMGLLCGLRPREDSANKIVLGLVLGTAISLFVPMAESILYEFSKAIHRPVDVSLQAAVELRKSGICEGDPVARISPLVTDLMWARATRTRVVSEVDYGLTYQFWQSAPEIREQVLSAMASSGAKIVVAHIPGDILVPPGWRQLGSTPFWIRELVEHEAFACKGSRPSPEK
jgi:hypothetical protein